MDDPLDREIDPGAAPGLQLEEPPGHVLQRSNDDADSLNRPWAIIAMVLLFGVVAALSVGFFLRSPRPAPTAEKSKGVEETIVDLPPDTSRPVAPAPAAPGASVARVPVAPPASLAPLARGRLLVRSSPADAEVFVDGKPRGKTPLALRELALGSYTIRVARRGYAVEERTVHLNARQPSTSTTINLRPEKSSAAPAAWRSATADNAGLPTRAMGNSTATVGRLNVQSRPTGARVYVNDRLAGTTPMSIASLPAGSATVRIEMDGYRQWSTKVHVNAGEQTRVAASLERP